MTGAVTFTASANGYTDGTAVKTIVQPAVQISSLSTSPTAGGIDDAFFVLVGTPNAGGTFMTDFQEVRAGAPAALTATLTTDNLSVGQLVTLAATGDTVTVDIVVGQNFSPTSVATGGVAFDPLAQGTTTIATTIPGFILLPSATLLITVSP